MKKVFTILSVVILALSFSQFSQASVDSIYEVAIINISGDVQVDTNGDGIWIKPWVGMKLMEKALIKTGKNSMIDIVFDAEGLNIARINANTLTTVKKALLELPDGKILAKFANLRPGTSFTIKTPTAACSIRGSGMGVGVANGVTEIMAFEDNVYVQGLDVSHGPIGPIATLPEGSRANVGPSGSLVNVGGLNSGDMAAFNQFQNDTSGSGTTGTGGAGEPDDTTEEVDTKDLDEIRDISPSN